MIRKRPVCCVLCRKELRTVQGLTGHHYAVHQRVRTPAEPLDPVLEGSWLPWWKRNNARLFKA